jgi:hypothetical protein
LKVCVTWTDYWYWLYLLQYKCVHTLPWLWRQSLSHLDVSSKCMTVTRQLWHRMLARLKNCTHYTCQTKTSITNHMMLNLVIFSKVGLKFFVLSNWAISIYGHWCRLILWICTVLQLNTIRCWSQSSHKWGSQRMMARLKNCTHYT